MKYKEKQNILQTYLRLPQITKDEFKQLIIFAGDKDVVVRSDVAAILINVENKASQKLLFYLACDKDALVRTEAYDSLSSFPYMETLMFLKRAIQTETDELACTYAILSWVDVVCALYENHSEDALFIKRIMRKSKIKKSEHCVLACFYALYKFECLNSLKQILRFFQSEDYKIRYSVYSTIKECVNSENRKEIINAIEKMLFVENSAAVRKAVIPFWKRLIIEQTLASEDKKKYVDENFTKTRSRLDEKRDILQTNLCLTKITKKEFRQLVALADDKNALVRIQAYKSLSVFPCAETEIFLKRAMQSERDGQACAYAISSWVKVVLALFDEHSYDELFIKWLMKRKKIKKSEYCLLECYYALYRFGRTGYLAQILKLYRSKDNRVHVMIDSILGECMESDGKEIIRIMEKVLITEESDAVRKEVIPLWKGLIVDHALSFSVKKE